LSFVVWIGQAVVGPPLTAMGWAGFFAVAGVLSAAICWGVWLTRRGRFARRFRK
jgi:hypothetical protein